MSWIQRVLLCAVGVLSAQEAPFFTGSLIAPFPTVVKDRDVLLRSYLYGTTSPKRYNRHWATVSKEDPLQSVNLQFYTFLGLNSWCDLNLTPQFFYQTASGEHSFDLGDLTVGIDLQLLEPQANRYPGIKLAIREVFPTGKYEFLRPRKYGADLTGQGTFATQFDLVLYQLVHLYKLHWLSMTLSLQYALSSPVTVHSFNAYGGGFGTRGKVLPGNRFEGVLSFELTLNQNWAFAFDSVYTNAEQATFYGFPGISLKGEFAKVGTPSSESVSFAPAIEYNFGPHLGIIGGFWFSAWGKNSPLFRSGVINVQALF